ncbi:hypothetical protein RJ640_027368 [Escallonia rubra]|uniref:RRM domain-containing protein n=1 Tax=Escallonia rubra TaxID=112253 RepID=A0AA88ULJ9_9ASTE|nr:hypothetical protein RJ640_027368 [Escallonia rubra]
MVVALWFVDMKQYAMLIRWFLRNPPSLPFFLSCVLVTSSMASADVEYRCFVGGLAWATTDRTLEDAFSQYGEVIDSKVRLTDPARSGAIRYYCYSGLLDS